MSKELPPSRIADQFVVRFPDGMRHRIAEVAKENNRSMNAELVARLQRTFDQDVGEAPVVDLTPELLEAVKREHTPGTPEAAALKRLQELKEAAEHQALLLFLGEIEYKRLLKPRSTAVDQESQGPAKIPKRRLSPSGK